MSRRTERVSRSIQVNLAELVNYHLNDPRVEKMVTVSQVEVSDDLHYARVRVTALGASETELRTIVRALNSAAGKLRSKLSDRVEMRVIPRLQFDIDEHALRTRATLEAIDRAMQQHTRPTTPPGEDVTATEENIDP